MSWTSAHATIVLGLQKTGRYAASMIEEETKILKMFWRFLELPKEHRITLHICDFLPPTSAEKASVGVFGKPLRGKKKNGDDHEAEPKVEHKVDPHWQSVRALLPGGSGHLLNSLYKLEYSLLRTQRGDMMISPNAMLGRRALMEKGYPEMEMLMENTFASIEEAAGQFGWPAEMQSTELLQASNNLCAVPHYIVLFGAGELVRAAIKFENFSTLGAHNNEAVFRLGDLTNLTMTYTVKTTSGAKEDFTRKLRGFFTDGPMGRLPAADAYAIVNSHSVDDLRQDTTNVENIGTRVRKTPLRVAINVEVIDSTYKSQSLRRRLYLQMLETILNQKPSVEDLHNRIDIATAWISKLKGTCGHDAEKAAVKSAWEDLLTRRTWNAEQLQALRLIRKAPGGLVCILGIAGTGQTLLQQGLAGFFDRLRLHVLCLTPINANDDDFALKLSAAAPNIGHGRLYPVRADRPAKGMATGGEEVGSQLPKDRLLEYDIALARYQAANNHHASARALGFQAEVIEQVYSLEPTLASSSCQRLKMAEVRMVKESQARAKACRHVGRVAALPPERREWHR